MFTKVCKAKEEGKVEKWENRTIEVVAKPRAKEKRGRNRSNKTGSPK